MKPGRIVEITSKPRLYMLGGRWVCAGIVPCGFFSSPVLYTATGKSPTEAWRKWRVYQIDPQQKEPL